MNREDDIKLFLFIFVGCPLAYVAYQLLPYVVFYVFPCAAISVVAGFIWALECEKDPVSYRFGIPFMAVTLVVLAIAVGFPSWHLSPGQKVEWPVLYNLFNGFNEDIQSSINWSWLTHFRRFVPGLPAAVYQPELYDRVHLAWALWLGVIVGAPCIFYKIAQAEDRTEIAKLKTDYQEKRKALEEELLEARRDYRRERSIRAEETEEKNSEIKKLKEVNEQLKKGVLSLPPAVMPDVLLEDVDVKTEDQANEEEESPKKIGIFDQAETSASTSLPSA